MLIIVSFLAGEISEVIDYKMPGLVDRVNAREKPGSVSLFSSSAFSYRGFR